MTEEKPLHVRVAEALFWEGGGPYVPTEHAYPGQWFLASDKGQPFSKMHGFVPRYDTDWSVTGPLIAKYSISLNYFVCADECCPPDGVRWTAAYGALGIEFPDVKAEAKLPLVAVCRLILALKVAGKLDVVPGDSATREER